MAARKQVFVRRENSEVLQKLLVASARMATEEELREQRISFAYGNALNNEAVTKETVRHSSGRVSLR